MALLVMGPPLNSLIACSRFSLSTSLPLSMATFIALMREEVRGGKDGNSEIRANAPVMSLLWWEGSVGGVREGQADRQLQDLLGHVGIKQS